jgi:PAS domain S-box-containing protein
MPGMRASPVRTRRLGGRPIAGESIFGEGDLRRLVDRAPDVVYRYGRRPPCFEFVSSAVTRLTGFTPEELYDDKASALTLVHHHDRGVVQELLTRGTGEIPTVVRWMRKDGSIAWVEQRNTPVYEQKELIAIEGIAREIADPTMGATPHVRVLGDIRIDLDRGRLLVSGQEVHLTPSEFRLMILLTAQPGRTITRATIMGVLWNSSYVGGGRTCEVHVSKLRRKIDRGASGKTRRIETVRGKGYRFIPSG